MASAPSKRQGMRSMSIFAALRGDGAIPSYGLRISNSQQNRTLTWAFAAQGRCQRQKQSYDSIQFS
jgi:hypothetical protein